LVVSVSIVNSEIGTIQDISRLSMLARDRGVYLHVDAAQAPCAMDTAELAARADLISLSGHKIYGPKGIGVLYVRRDIQQNLTPVIRGGGQQNNLRSGTVPVPLCVGFATAADILLRQGREERSRLAGLRDELLGLLQALPYPVRLNGPSTERHPGNLNVRFEGFAADDVLAVMQPRLAASTGSACTSGIPEPSYVLRAIGLSHDQAASSIRFCVGRDTTRQDVQDAGTLIAEALQKLQLEAA
jgi:cysteine desulfurase